MLLTVSYDCIYWYTSEELVKRFMDTLGKRFHMNFLGYAHWFMSISISQLNDYSIPVYQARYVIAVVSKYLDTYTIKENSITYNQATCELTRSYV